MTCSRVGLHDELRVPGAEAGGGQPGEAGLVVDGIVGEAEGEGEHRLRHQLAHHPHDYGRVDPARQEGTQGHVGHQPLAYRLACALAHAPHGLRVGDGARGEVEPPVAPLAESAVVIEHARARGRHPQDPPVEGARRRHVTVGQVVRESVLVPARFRGHLEQRLDLAGERQQPPGPRQEARLLARPVAGQKQTAMRLVPDREGEHAVHPLGKRVSPRLVAVHQDLGVAPRAEAVPPSLQLGPELFEVVDVAVENGVHAAVLVGHRLPAGLQVDHAQARMTEGAAPGGSKPARAFVGAAVREPLRHRAWPRLPRRAAPLGARPGRRCHTRQGAPSGEAVRSQRRTRLEEKRGWRSGGSTPGLTPSFAA